MTSSAGARRPLTKTGCRSSMMGDKADIWFVHPSSIASPGGRRTMMIIFVIILLVNSLTLVITIVAAIKRPILSYMLIGVVALCATLFARHQVVTVQGNPFALMFTALLIVMIAWSRIV
jgi:hypothetical protein